MPRANSVFHLAVLSAGWLCLLLFAVILSSCHYERDDDAWAATDAKAEVDSVDFRNVHHYWKGYNFAATDSFGIASRAPFQPVPAYAKDSTIHIAPNDVMAVEDIQKDTTLTDTTKMGTLWVKVATLSRHAENSTSPATRSGWIKEEDLMKHVVPDAPVSKVIRALGSPVTKWALGIGVVLLGVVLLGLRLRRHLEAVGAQSLYPVLLNIIVSGSVVLHRSIWHFVPDTWVEFYFYPTLNPFSPELPPVVALFVLSLWLLLLVGMAMVDDLRHKTGGGFTQFVLTLLILVVRGAAIFAVFAVICPFWLLYPALLVYWFIILRRYLRFYRRHTTFRCGHCGRTIRRLGPCPYCGAINR